MRSCARRARILPRRSSTRRHKPVIAFIDDHREAYGVEPICRVLPIAPSTYHAPVARRADPTRLSGAGRDGMHALMPGVSAGVRGELRRAMACGKVWRQLKREGHDVARCTVAAADANPWFCRAMLRGKPARTDDQTTRRRRARWTTSIGSSRPRIRMRCGSLTSPMSRLGRASSTSPSSSMHTRDASLAGACREPASCGLRARCAGAGFCMTGGPSTRGGLVHHSDRGSQYVSI